MSHDITPVSKAHFGVSHNSKELTTTQALDNFRQSWLPWSTTVSYGDTKMFSSCSDAASVFSNRWSRLKTKVDFEWACQNKRVNYSTQQDKYRTVKSFKSQYFQNYYLAVISSTIIVIVSSDYLYITSIWGISELSLSTHACQREMTWLVGRSDSIGRMSASMTDGGSWLDDHWQCRYTSVLHTNITNTHFRNTVNYTKIALSEVCVWESGGISTRKRHTSAHK